MSSRKYFCRCQYQYNWCQYHDIAISLSLMKKTMFSGRYYGRSNFGSRAHLLRMAEVCRQGGFRREDIVFCWCLQSKSYFVDLFGNKVDRNRHMTYIARSWDGRNDINSFCRKLLARKKRAFRKRVCLWLWSSAHRLSILAYRYDIEVINFTVNRSTPYRWHPYKTPSAIDYIKCFSYQSQNFKNVHFTWRKLGQSIALNFMLKN